MPSSPRRVSTALAATALFTAGFAAFASTASAKSDLSIGTTARTVAVGGVVGVHAVGTTDDFGGAPIRLCIEERVGAHAWRTLSCTAGYRLSVSVRPTVRGEVFFRSQLIALPGAHHGHRVVDRTSETLAVQAR
jgi:hypothetical protein